METDSSAARINAPAKRAILLAAEQKAARGCPVCGPQSGKKRHAIEVLMMLEPHR
jgi:hypothetical protein